MKNTFSAIFVFFFIFVAVLAGAFLFERFYGGEKNIGQDSGEITERSEKETSGSDNISDNVSDNISSSSDLTADDVENADKDGVIPLDDNDIENNNGFLPETFSDNVSDRESHNDNKTGALKGDDEKSQSPKPQNPLEI